ncbi:MAG: hypothetical protein ACI8ZF_000731 [Candidatus Midichloriaceae bacterium]|jgi:hypothetical protein
MVNVMELEKRVIEVYRDAESLKKFNLQIYTFIPENPEYPFIKISEINKTEQCDAGADFSEVSIKLSVFTNDTSNQKCLEIANEIDNIGLNEIDDSEDYGYFKFECDKFFQNSENHWQYDYLISLIIFIGGEYEKIEYR